MDLFPDRAHVRLRSRVRGTYLAAHEDGRCISLSGRRASLNTAWQVHRVLRPNGVTYVLLQGAAYSRYLLHTAFSAPRGHRGSRTIQGVYFDPGQVDVLWEAVRVGVHVLLRDISGRLLRANGRYRRWYNGVSVDDGINQSLMMHWEVRAYPPESGAARASTSFYEEVGRIISYAQVDDLEHYDPLDRVMCWFVGRSVSHLRDALANLLNVDNSLNITLCAQSGVLGRPVPLVVDLPSGYESMTVIVLTTGSPAALELQHPNVDE